MAISMAAGDRLNSEQGALVLEKMLGRGAFGEVWKCRDVKEDKARAVKIVRSQELERLGGSARGDFSGGSIWGVAPERPSMQIVGPSHFRSDLGVAGSDDKWCHRRRLVAREPLSRALQLVPRPS